MNVEIAVSWRTDVLKAVLVLRRGCPRWVWSWGWDHHEERFKIRFVLQEVQWHVGLRRVLLKNISPFTPKVKSTQKTPNKIKPSAKFFVPHLQTAFCFRHLHYLGLESWKGCKGRLCLLMPPHLFHISTKATCTLPSLCKIATLI